MSLTEKLIEQSKRPNGFVGKTMLGIMNGAHSMMARWGLSYVDIANADTILDIGCGGGKTIKDIAKLNAGAKIYGIDISKSSVAATQKLNRKNIAAGKVTALVADVCDMPFDDGFFDVAVAVQTHFYWPDLARAFRKIYRALKPSGSFVLIAEIFKMDYHMPRYKTVAEQRELLFKTGFQKVELHGTGKESCFVCTK